MVRVALAQIFFKPAIIERSVDHLSEPGLVQGDVCATSLLEVLPPDKSNDLRMWQDRTRSDYITYITRKLQEVCKQACHIYRPDLLVFPEYSVPCSCLPVLQDMARQYKITIVAGSHTVRSASKDYYAQVGLDFDINTYQGCSIAPIFFPDGKADYQVKHDRSIFEITMKESEEPFKCFDSITQDGEAFSFYVVICADALSAQNLGRLKLSREKNLMVLTIAYSTKTDGFQSAANLLAVQRVPMLICNTSLYGGSGIYLSKSVKERFVNSPGQPSWLEPHTEALMMLNFHPKKFAVERSVLDTDVRGSWAACPILYGEKLPWVKEYKQTLNGIEESLKEGNIGDAADYVDILLTLYENQIPTPLFEAFRYFTERMDNFCGDVESYMLPLRCIWLPFHSTQAHLRNEIMQALNLCMQFGLIAYQWIGELMKQQQEYPEEPIVSVQPVLPSAIARPVPTQEEALEFRDRGHYMNQLQEAILDPTVRLVLVNGAYGIGKSSLVAVNFKRNLPNWQVQTISLTPTTRFSMVLEYMANAIGYSLKADQLTSSGKKALRPILEKFTKALLAKDGHAIVVDQLESILLNMQGKDHTLLTLFRDAVYQMKSGQGKIIFLSDVRFSSEIFPESPAVRRIVVGRISDNNYVKKILEYEMRRHEMTSPGQTPVIPNRLYELVNGHPLTAKLCVEAMSRQKHEALEDIPLSQVQSQVIKQLLKKINLDPMESRLVSLLSVFRTRIEVPRLETHLSPEHKQMLKENMNKFYMSSFISAGEHALEITAAFRNYYYEQLSENDRQCFHEYALCYYKGLHEELVSKHLFSAMIYAEIAYHLTQLNQIEQLKEYLPGNVNTLKQLAKALYQRDKNYMMALQLYLILYETDHNDIEVLSYLGRCHARLGDWESSRARFQDAISAAERQKENTWYLYRDWGHMYVRYNMDEDAKEKLSEARFRLRQETTLDDDAGILSAEGFLDERNHDLTSAVEKYEAALNCNPYHEFTIQNYSSLLRKQGKDQAANELEERLQNANYENLGELTDNFYSGFDILGLDLEMDD